MLALGEPQEDDSTCLGYRLLRVAQSGLSPPSGAQWVAVRVQLQP